MCWSWEVSLAFSLLQITCIAYIVRRNALLDRWLALYQLPIATQEFVQFLLWAFVFNDDDLINKDYRPDDFIGSDLCTSLNRVLTYVLFFVVNRIPIIMCIIYVYVSVGV